MKLVADENVDRQIVDRLRIEGHDVLYIAEFDAGIDDRTVLLHSLQTDAILLTGDKDFGELVFRQRLVHAGVLLIRLEGLDPDMKAALVAATINRHGDAMCSAFSVLSPRSFRLRKPIQ